MRDERDHSVPRISWLEAKHEEGIQYDIAVSHYIDDDVHCVVVDDCDYDDAVEMN